MNLNLSNEVGLCSYYYITVSYDPLLAFTSICGPLPLFSFSIYTSIDDPLPLLTSHYIHLYFTLLIVTLNITPMHMMNAAYAKKVTGAEDLTDEQKHQIQEQQKVRAQFHHTIYGLVTLHMNTLLLLTVPQVNVLDLWVVHSIKFVSQSQ